MEARRPATRVALRGGKPVTTEGRRTASAECAPGPRGIGWLWGRGVACSCAPCRRQSPCEEPCALIAPARFCEGWAPRGAHLLDKKSPLTLPSPPCGRERVFLLSLSFRG